MVNSCLFHDTISSISGFNHMIDREITISFRTISDIMIAFSVAYKPVAILFKHFPDFLLIIRHLHQHLFSGLHQEKQVFSFRQMIQFQ